MRQSAVGQKCPSCAHVPRSARALGKPVHYVRGVAAGLGLALVGGFIIVEVLLLLGGFGSIILSALLGFGVGMAVSWGTKGQTQAPFPAVAAGCAVVGLVAAFGFRFGLQVFTNPWQLLALAAGGYFAVRGLHR